ncbi:MAG: type II toxin-antitoxin system PemK/MazF family toxin [Candidatus Xenobia bacterium]
MVSRGEVWLVDFGTTEAAERPEQAKVRPALVLSVNEVNHYGELAIVIPITTTIRALVAHLQLKSPEGGLDRDSALQCDQIRAISIRRFRRILGTVTATTLEEVKNRLTWLLGFR